MKLLEQVRQTLRVRRFALRTKQVYLRWIEQYIHFPKGPDGFRHPAEMGAAEIEQFLTHLAVQCPVAASTQNQALAALLFLYRAWLAAQKATRNVEVGDRTTQTVMAAVQRCFVASMFMRRSSGIAARRGFTCPVRLSRPAYHEGR